MSSSTAYSHSSDEAFSSLIANNSTIATDTQIIIPEQATIHLLVFKKL